MALDEKRRQKKLAKKAAERKVKHAERRSLTTGGSSVMAARFPVGECLAPIGLFEEGIGHLILTRSLPDGHIAVAGFLVDTFCLGVKNALYRVISPEEFEYYRQQIEAQTPLESIHPSCLRKLVESAVNYAQDIGIPPHPDYAKASRLFGNIDASACPAHYTFGKDGKPFYINGPSETPAQQRKILETLTRKLGPKGFDYMVMVGDPEDADIDRPSVRPVKQVSYQVSDEPPEDSAFAKLPQSVKDEISRLHEKTLKKPGEAISDLLSMIGRYPDLPQIYNYLQIAYKLSGDQTNAERVLEETLERFPDYLFGRITQANECLDRGELDRIPEIFEGKYDLGLLYPDRKRFHISEVLNFNMVMARYFHAKGENDKAEMYYKVLHQLDSQHSTTQLVGRLLHPQPKPMGEWLRNLLPQR